MSQPEHRVDVPASQRSERRAPDTTFRFVDLFAGIGGIRAGLSAAGGRCDYTVEKDKYAVRTYEANWGTVDARDVTQVNVGDLPPHEILAAGFPCQPFSLAGVSKKAHLGRPHGFDDATSGNRFFDIIRLVGGPWQEPVGVEEATTPDGEGGELDQVGTPSPGAPPIILLENVRHLLSHDQKRTFRVIQRRLLASGYRVSHALINGAVWVPQNRRRTIIVALRKDLFAGPFVFGNPGDELNGPKLGSNVLERDSDDLERYRLTPGTWNALLKHRARHEKKGTGFGYGVAEVGGVTRTLSARYFKDGAEILIPMRDEGIPRRLTPRECARLMGFTRDHLGFDFEIPVSDSQAYRQFGNSVVVPQFRWIAREILAQAGPVLAEHMGRSG